MQQLIFTGSSPVYETIKCVVPVRRELITRKSQVRILQGQQKQLAEWAHIFVNSSISRFGDAV